MEETSKVHTPHVSWAHKAYYTFKLLWKTLPATEAPGRNAPQPVSNTSCAHGQCCQGLQRPDLVSDYRDLLG